MTPDFETAAVTAAETLIQYGIKSAPVDPLPVLKSRPGVLVVSFAEMAAQMGLDRGHVINMFGKNNQDAVTTVRRVGASLRYIVAYNQRLPFYMLQRGLARELGHIVLKHDGTRPDDVRQAEAVCFAQHFLCPRALIRSIADAGIPLTVEVVGNVTGCYERCLAGMRKTPGVNVPAALNQKIRAQFSDYVNNFVEFQNILKSDDESMLANFGSFMDGYKD